jgi:hypothetical protein
MLGLLSRLAHKHDCWDLALAGANSQFRIPAGVSGDLHVQESHLGVVVDTVLN